MVKKALCVGINDYPYDGADLNGCVNDARAWVNLLTVHYGFATQNVKLLVDRQARKSEIIQSLKSIASGTKKGDVLVFTISSQGTQLPDPGREMDYSEAICPYDCADNLIAIAEVYDIFLELMNGVHITIVLDTSFTGQTTRSIVSELIPGLRTPDERRMRFLTSSTLYGWDVNVSELKILPKREHSQAPRKTIILRASSRIEYAYDALINGIFHGAMTFFALKAIRETNYKITYAQLEARLCYLLDEAGYPQHPQIVGSNADKKRQVFT